MTFPQAPGPIFSGIEDVKYVKITGSSAYAQYLGMQAGAGLGAMMVPNVVQPVVVMNGETATPGGAKFTDFIHSGGHAFTPSTKSAFEFIPGDPTGLGNIAIAALTLWANSILPAPLGAIFTTENTIDPAGIIVVHDVFVSADRDSAASVSNMYCGLMPSTGSAPAIITSNSIEAAKQSLSGFEGSGRLLLGLNSVGPGISETPNTGSTNWISAQTPGLMYQRVYDQWRPFEKVTPFILPLNRRIVGGQSETGAPSSPGFGVGVVWQQIPLPVPS